MLDVVYGEASEVGRVWPINADSAAVYLPRSEQEVRSRGWMFAVADGRGGTELGEVTSSRAVRMMVEGFARAVEGESLANLMPGLIQYVNSAVHDKTPRPGGRGRKPGTTLVSCALRGSKAVIAHVGDSRCYHVRDRQATLLTQDHTLAAEQRNAGAMTATQAEHSEERHVLTRTLGSELEITADTVSVNLTTGDVLILCTDGLYKAVYPEDIASIASLPRHPRELAAKLVSYALQVDGSDNTTAQVIRILSANTFHERK
jgi:serine/threonine protein phosphatase PrpC